MASNCSLNPLFSEFVGDFVIVREHIVGCVRRAGRMRHNQSHLCLFSCIPGESDIIERLEREKRCCTVEKTGDDLYTLTADVFDPNEIMHWAKTFIGRIVSIEGGADSVRQRFYSDIARMNRMYGGDEDEHIQ